MNDDSITLRSLSNLVYTVEEKSETIWGVAPIEENFKKIAILQSKKILPYLSKK